jgi:hypothetical protein
LLSIIIWIGIVYFFGSGELKDNILLGIILWLSSVWLYQWGKEFYSKNPSNNEQPSFDITPEIGEFH